MSIYSIDGFVPVIHPSAFVHPSAQVIGDVIVGRNCYIGPGAVLRGDFGRIQIDDQANIQDTCVMHAFPNLDCRVRAHGHIGHGSVLHGCEIGEDAMVGINAVVLDGAHISARSIVGACAMVTAQFTCPEQSLIIGIPAKVKRALSEEEVEWKRAGTRDYVELARRHFESHRPCEPLAEPEPDRPRFDLQAVEPKFMQGKGAKK